MFIYCLSYLSLFSSMLSEFTPLPLSREVKEGSKGQLVRVLPPPSLTNPCDHHTVGYKRWADSKLEHSHFIPGGGCHSAFISPHVSR